MYIKTEGENAPLITRLNMKGRKKMTQEELKQKLDELNENEEFLSRMAECESIEEMVSLFSEQGVIVDAAELESALKLAAVQSEEGELNEDSLESVSGGIAFATLCAAWMCCNLVIAGSTFLKNTVFKKKKK